MAELERLRTAYAGRPAAPGDHLTEQQWEQLACGELGSDARRAAHEHIVGCRQCTTIARAVMAIRVEAPSFDPGAPQLATRGRHSGVTWLRRAGAPVLLAAAAAALVFIGVRMQLGSGPNTSSAAASEPIMRAARTARTPLPIAPVGGVSTAPPELRWEPVEGAVGYVVEILDDSGEELWTSAETTATTIPWPTSIKPGPGRSYWRVTAYREEGPPLSSRLVAFDLELTTSPR